MKKKFLSALCLCCGLPMLKTKRSLDVLMGYALGLERKCYDEAGRLKDLRTCPTAIIVCAKVGIGRKAGHK
jgi:hypothetical protein